MMNAITILSKKQLTPQKVKWKLSRKGVNLDKKGKVAINDECYNNLVQETTNTTESEVEITQKRGQPRQKGESGNKEWEDMKKILS